ncbi:TAT-variant-translocated molybdopterin oxidoreductase [Olivibacter sitiensis]|uniref:TAT-variant-translocated molybdopterin oxidoreductase n=1 Tax=Olivibacter sitiensis TaxID=376470 RepID=UPI0003FD7D3E|nr:TAT-variant-translocated molybdopterin oxidoreductase [Olivibacter sitiensis]
MDSNKKYWKGLEELQQTPAFVENSKSEFAEPLPIENVLEGPGLEKKTPRRDFLKKLGFGIGAVSLAACQNTPVHKSIPYLIKPEEVTPGIPNYYASSYNGQSVLVKTREGRPILIEANPAAKLLNCGTDAATQASVLDLYDTNKLKDPKIGGRETGWAKVDKAVIAALDEANASGKQIRIVSSTLNSPTALSLIAQFTAKYPTTKLVEIDSVSYAGIIKANQNSFGKAVIPHYRFDKAEVIVSVSADFIGTWLSGEEYTQQFISKRDYKSLENGKMSRLIQFESGMSLTGSNADARIPIKVSEEVPVLIALYNAITGNNVAGAIGSDNAKAQKVVALASKELLQAKGKSVVVAGSNNVAVQSLVNAINVALENYGNTIDLDNASYQYKGNDTDFESFLNEAKAGNVGVAFFLNTNPAYDYYDSKKLADALEKIKTKISFSDREDETSVYMDILAPNHSYLESWGDGNALTGYYTIVQPTINPVYNTRQYEQSLLIWSGSEQDYYDYLRAYWEQNILAGTGRSWDDMLQTGFEYKGEVAAQAYSFNGDINSIAQQALSFSKSFAKDVEVQLYQSIALRDGKQGNNALLHELPDPISKVTWDNYVAISPAYAKSLGIVENDVLKVTGENGYTVELPVLLQPGQAQGTVSIAVGYGRSKVGKAGNNIGKNAYPFAKIVDGAQVLYTTAKIEKTGDSYILAQTQTHHTIEGRNVVRETSFKDYLHDPAHGSGNHGTKHKTYDLWNKYESPGHKWVLAIDLNACTGCGSCIVACNLENNIPVVGRDEVRRRREMHWMRVDRYYSFNVEGNEVTKEKELASLSGEDLDDVSVVHQPMMCQHCDHAPCETVCPVLATVHSNEGLNHMAYNRCFGTRYCANNCPYKVRRFNWFNYWNDSRFDNYLNNEFTQLVLNPDVTSRTRGVMEKCSMCIQRIQAGKLKAKMEKRPLKDGDIVMACGSACSANAIIFGDLNDPNSEVSKALKNERVYYVLEEINVQPNVGYMTKVRNTLEA